MSSQKPSSGSQSFGSTFLVVIVFVVAVIWVGAAVPDAVTRWAVTAGLMVALLVVIGMQVNERPDGVLIDNRYKMSLSRLQIVLWTILVMSAFLAIALPRSLPNGLAKPTQEQTEACKEDERRKYVISFNESPPANVEDSKDVEETMGSEDAEAAKDVAGTEGVEGTESNEAAEEAAGTEGAEGTKGDEDTDNVQCTVPVEDFADLTARCPLIAEEAEEQVAEACTSQPLQIVFPEELLLALGISVTSFAGSSLIKQTKKDKKPDLTVSQKKVDEAQQAVDDVEKKKKKVNEDIVDTADNAQGRELTEAEEKKIADLEAQDDDLEKDLAEAERTLEGAKAEKKDAEGSLLHKNTDPSQAKWVDMFRGEEVSNWRLIDMSKVQMFFFTIAVIFAYGVQVYNLLNDQPALTAPPGVEFPAFAQSLNVLLGISHGGYLAVKAPDHTKTAS